MSLRQKLVLILLLFQLFLVASLVWQTGILIRENHEEDVDKGGQALAESLAVVLKDSVIAENLAALKQTLNSTYETLDDQGVDYLALYNENQEVIFEFGESLATTRAFQKNVEVANYTFAMIHVGISADYISSDIVSDQKDLIKVAALQMLVFTLVTLFLSKFLTEPIKKLQQATRRLAGGKLDTRVAIKGRDELQQLGQSFNEMADHLQETHAELQNKAETARAAEKAKSEFLSTMSHEIRTPLNAVIGMSQVLKETRLDPRQKTIVNNIHTSGQHLMHLINDVLDFSRIEAGQVELHIEPVNIREQLANVVEILRHDAVEKGLDLVLNVSPGVKGCYRCDIARLRQILFNLAGNAIKFSEKGVVEINVRTDSSEMLKIEVVDQGPGIPEARQAQLFNRFTQADASITRQYGGTGLGLAICRALVNLMGGEIGLESQTDMGSTFWFSLPLDDCVLPDLNAVEQPAKTSSKKSLVILVAEDNVTNQLLMRILLEKEGHQAEYAENGQQAVEILQNGQFDLILMDMHMPVMDGLEATRQIRAMDGQKNKTPIIMVSAESQKSMQDEMLTAGADDFVLKPVDIEQLRRSIERVVNRDFTLGA